MRRPVIATLLVVPTLLVAALGGIVHVVDPGGFVAFGLGAVGVIGLNQAVAELRRREERAARPGWEFFAPVTLLAARAGRAFGVAVAVVLAALFCTGEPVWLGLAVVVASLAAWVGVQLLVRLVRGASVLRIGAGGVEVRGVGYTWDRISAVELNGDRVNPRLDLVVQGRRAAVTLRPGGVDASLLFLTDLLGYYRSHAHLRGAIGDPAEAERVHGLLLCARLAAGLHGGPRPILVAS
jgi:hypothetical protein